MWQRDAVKHDGLSHGDRRALTSVAVQFFVNGMLFASFIPRLPEIRDRIDIGNGGLGALLAAGAAAGVLGSALVGRLVERLGTRRLLIGAGLALCASLAVVGVAAAPAVFVLGLAAMSVFDVLVDSAMNLQGSWISGRRRAPVMNRLHGLWSLGTVVGGVGASRLADAGVSLRLHLFVVAGVLMLVVLAVGRGLLRHDEDAAVESSDAATDGGAGARARRGTLIVLSCAGAASIAMEVTSNDWAAIRLRDDFGTTLGFSGLAFVAFTVGMTSGRLGGDWAVARLGARRVADLTIVCASVGLLAASFAQNRWLVMVGYVLVGLGVATQFPRLYDEAARLPGRRGEGLGALTGGSRVALLVTPIVVGTLAQSRLSVGAATAVVTLPAIVAFFVLTRPRATN